MQQTGRSFRELLAGLWNLTKFKQTLLLLITGACGYIISRPHSINWNELGLGMLALYAAVSGCTVLNMVFDSDMDAGMARTAQRPLPRGIIKMVEAVLFGSMLSYVGLWLSWQLMPVFGMVVAAGFIIDLCIYTLWLKRITPYSIIWGGMSGGMPALAGRALACGCLDFTGLLLALSVLFWIPTHILTLVLRHAEEYAQSGGAGMAQPVRRSSHAALHCRCNAVRCRRVLRLRLSAGHQFMGPGRAYCHKPCHYRYRRVVRGFAPGAARLCAVQGGIAVYALCFCFDCGRGFSGLSQQGQHIRLGCKP